MISEERRPTVRALSRLAPALVVALALLHALLYAWLVPPWQAPDEPTQFEYAALAARLGRVPASTDVDPELEQQLVDSLVRQHFFEYLVHHPPDKPLHSLDDARAVFFMPRQVGADPPLYFLIAALPLRVLAAAPIETQLLVLRLLGALFVASTALCVYAAAHELCADDRRPTTDHRRPTTDHRRPTTDDVAPSPAHPLTRSPAHLALAVGLLVALHPMFVFIGVGAGNDGLANLLGAAICWALLRAVRCGLSLRRAATLLALVLLGVFTKRTLLPVALLLALLGGGLAVLRLARAPLGRTIRLGLGGALLLALVLAASGVLASGRENNAAAEWWNPATSADASRVLAAPGTGRAALELSPGLRLIQPLPGITAEWTQNQELYFSARVWTDEQQARGRVLIDFGWATTEVPFEVSARGRIARVHTFIPLYCPYVLVAVQSDEGMIYADQLRAESDRRRGLELLANGDVTTAAVRAGAPFERLAHYLRLRELAWVWRSGRLLEPPPLGWGLGRIFLVSFWGQFGWMSLPLVGGTPWESALWLLCGGGLAGAAFWVARPGCAAWRRRAAALLLALILAGLLLPLLNAYTQTRDQVIQQGRYLFPAMAPIALLLALGWRALVPPRWRAAGLVVWTLWWALFAAAALGLIVRFYGSR
ncbi:MAG: hypothetical protein ACJ8CR_21065 [Roseiflexaceae bacterium]